MDKDTDISINLLLLAKSFCLKAVEEYDSRTMLGRMLSVMNMQDAIEFSMSAISFKYQISQNLNDNHTVRWKNIDDTLTNAKNKEDKLILKQQVDAINTARNRVKHHGSVPSEEDASLHLRVGRTFLEDVFLRLFGCEFDKLSQVDLIHDNAVQAMLKTAEEQITRADYLEALVSIKDAFIRATPNIHYLVGQVGYYSHNNSFINVVPDNNNSALQESVMYLLLGLDLVKLKRFMRLTPYYHYQFDNGIPVSCSIMWRKSIKPSKQISQNALMFVVDAVLGWQEGGLLNQQEDDLEPDLGDDTWQIIRKTDL